MKKVLSIIMIIAITAPSFIKTGILLDFKIHQDFIVKVLCINKDIPESTCNGKCHLTKQLKKVEKQQEGQTPINQSLKLELVYCNSKLEFNLLKYIDFNAEPPAPTFKNGLYNTTFLVDIFKPPRRSFI